MAAAEVPVYHYVGQEDPGEHADSCFGAADAASPSLSRSRSVRTAIAKPPASLTRQLQRLTVPAKVILMLVAVVLLSAAASARFLSSSRSRPKHIANAQGGQHVLRRPRVGASTAKSSAGLPIAREDEVIFQNSTAAPESGAANLLNARRSREQRAVERERLAEAEFLKETPEEKKEGPEEKKEGPAEDERERPAEDEKERPAEDKKERPAEDKKERRPAERKKERPEEDEKERPAEGKKERPAEGKNERPAEDERERPVEDRKERPAEDKKQQAAEGKKERLVEGQKERPAKDTKNTSAEHEVEDFLFEFLEPAYISWSMHPSKCWDIISHHPGYNNGMRVQLWDCDDNPEKFLIPEGGFGPIKLAADPTYCLDAPRHGPILQFWKCAVAPRKHLMFHVPTNRSGMIRPATYPDKCVDIPNDNTSDGAKVQLWNCSAQNVLRDMSFVIHWPAVSQNSTAAPTEAISRTSTAAPTEAISHTSTAAPTEAISQTSTAAPTEAISRTSTAAPTEAISRTSTAAPTEAISQNSTAAPTEAISQTSTAAPTEAISQTSTAAPTEAISQTSTAAPTEAPKPKIVDLFCWALIVPWGYERELVMFQHKSKLGIFACDTHAVYSNVTMDLGGLKNKLVYTSLSAPVGGQWKTLLNTPIFVATWKQVIKDGQFLTAEWTVKVDADAVFFPERLRGLVKAPGHEHPQWGNGMFADNCGYTRSMHGPIELFSRRALAVWNERGATECKQPPQEDVYMRECMLQLGVKELYDFNLLAEQSCFWDWWNCQDPLHVVFHPFKKLSDYQGCLSRAKHPTPPPQR